MPDSLCKTLHAEVNQPRTFNEPHAGSDHKRQNDDAGSTFKAIWNSCNDLQPSGRMRLNRMVCIGNHQILNTVNGLNYLAVILPGRHDVRKYGHQKYEEPEDDIDIGHLEAFFLLR